MAQSIKIYIKKIPIKKPQRGTFKIGKLKLQPIKADPILKKAVLTNTL